MAEKNSEFNQTIYNIPDNFIDESRVIRGMFRTKYLVEAIILSLPFLFLSLLVPANTTEQRITISTIFVCLPMIIGITGIQGDTVFTFIRNFFRWKKSSGIYLYNFESRSLINTQADNMLNEDNLKMKVSTYLAARKKNREESREIHYQEGDELEFATDKHLEGNYLDEYEEYEECENDDKNDSLKGKSEMVEGEIFDDINDFFEEDSDDFVSSPILPDAPIKLDDESIAEENAVADRISADFGAIEEIDDWESEVF